MSVKVDLISVPFNKRLKNLILLLENLYRSLIVRHEMNDSIISVFKCLLIHDIVFIYDYRQVCLLVFINTNILILFYFIQNPFLIEFKLALPVIYENSYYQYACQETTRLVGLIILNICKYL